MSLQAENEQDHDDRGQDHNLSFLQRLRIQYESFVLSNIELVSTSENFLKMGLYMVPGRLGQSEMAIDGVYSAIALVSLYHDLVFVRAVRRRLEERKLTCGGLKLPDERWLMISKALSALSAVELFTEVLCVHKFGEKGRWRAVYAIEFVRTMLRVLLLLHNRGAVMAKQSIPSRDEVKFMLSSSDYSDIDATTTDRLQSCLDPSPSLAAPSLASSTTSFSDDNDNTVSPSRLKRPTLLEYAQQQGASSSSPPEGRHIYRTSPSNPTRLAGELLYAFRPLIYLFLRRKLGATSWTHWLLSLGIDFAARSMSATGPLNVDERGEVQRRIYQWIFYLMRSPCWEKFTSTGMLAPLSPFRRWQRIDNLVQSAIALVEAYRSHYFYYAGSS